MKKVLICVLIFALIFIFAGCGAKETQEEKMAEKIFKGANGRDLDIDGDKVTIKGQNDEKVTFGDNKWPSSALAKSVPKFKYGIVSAVLESPDSVVITLESVQKNDSSTYLEIIKRDFTQDVYEINDEDMMSFSGKNNANVSVALTYMSEVLVITITSPEL